MGVDASDMNGYRIKPQDLFPGNKVEFVGAYQGGDSDTAFEAISGQHHSGPRFTGGKWA